jgi:uncharacterized membrane protein
MSTIKDNRRVIGRSCLPVRLPLFHGITLWLLLDRLGANGITFGIVGTLWGLLFLVAVIEWIHTEERDLTGYGDKS